MKILLCHYDELDELGGVETLIRTMAREFTAMGHPAGVVEMGEKARARRELLVGVPIWTIAGSTFPRYGRPRSWASFARSTLQFRHVVGEFNPDIVHVHFPAGQCLPVVGADLLPHRWRLVVTVHNSDIRAAPRDASVRHWQARLFERADRVTAVSDSLLVEAQGLYASINGKGRTVYNGIASDWEELSRQAPVKESRYILYAGRLHTVKGLYPLLDAWKILAQRRPDITLMLAGDGPERAGLIDHANRLGIRGTVDFAGIRNREELAALYRDAECVVLPSEREGLAMVLLEAAACGAICVGSHVTGIQEVIEDGVTGFLVPYGNPHALAEAMMAVLTLPLQKRDEMKQASRRRVQRRFTQEAMLQGYIRIYSELVGSGTRVHVRR